MAALLEISFDGDVLGSGYYLGAQVRFADDIPLRSLIFQRGTRSQNEKLVRVATMEDLDLPETGAPHNVFASPRLQTKDWTWPPPGDYYYVIYFYYISQTHPEWLKLDPAFVPYRKVTDILEPNKVRLDNPLPSFARNVFYTYRYYNNPTPPAPPVVADLPDDGFVDRQYPDEEGIYYRSDFSFALLNSLDEGLARKESLKSQAQSLVDAANAAYPTYEGDDTYDFS